jgi:ribosomal protein S18 acetylase RimI-like enzyme
MAAVPEARIPQTVDLWQIRVEDLGPLFEEEIRAWRRDLSWDFQTSADLIRRFIDVRALNGYALTMGGELAGYAYFVGEEHKGLIGDLFVREQYRSADTEYCLLAAVVDRLTGTRAVRRIESQLMMTRSLGQRPLPAAKFARSYRRNFMMVDVRTASRLPERSFESLVFLPWIERHQDETARLIASAYRGHIDGDINDQYRSPAGARRFLMNIVQYPGCGTFFQPASWAAIHTGTGQLCGVSLTSMVAPEVGHITQICVAPGVKGKGVGYELLRRSLVTLAEAGAQSTSLTVTASNDSAVRLYERVGFDTVRQFPAFVWEGF